MGADEISGGCAIEDTFHSFPIAVIHKGGTREAGGHGGRGGRSASGREGDGWNEGLGRCRRIRRGIGWGGGHRGQGVLNVQVGCAVHIPVKGGGDAFACFCNNNGDSTAREKLQIAIGDEDQQNPAGSEDRRRESADK